MAAVEFADEFVLDGTTVTLIDIPGFDDTSKSDADILKIISAFLATTYVHTYVHSFSILWIELVDRYKRESRLSGIIYLHSISDKRFTGVAGRNFNIFRKLCGDAALANVVLVTNMWGEVSPEVGEARESELSGNFFKPVLDLGAQMVRHHNTVHSAHDVIRRITWSTARSCCKSSGSRWMKTRTSLIPRLGKSLTENPTSR